MRRRGAARLELGNDRYPREQSARVWVGETEWTLYLPICVYAARRLGGQSGLYGRSSVLTLGAGYWREHRDIQRHQLGCC